MHFVPKSNYYRLRLTHTTCRTSRRVIAATYAVRITPTLVAENTCWPIAQCQPPMPPLICLTRQHSLAIGSAASAAAAIGHATTTYAHTRANPAPLRVNGDVTDAVTFDRCVLTSNRVVRPKNYSVE